MNETKLKRWKVDAGNSGTGPCGFVVYDIMAATKEEALEAVQAQLPQEIEDKQCDDHGDQTITIVAYFNPTHLTLDNIEEDEEE